jgi:hypothetical protein
VPRVRAGDVRAAALVLLIAAVAAPAAALDVVLLRNGDRVSGRIVGETSKSLRIQTPYGRLAIPRERIERIQREGKPEQVLNPPQVDVAPAIPRRDPLRARLMVVVLGKTFWRAWHPKDVPADTTLRFEVTVDEETAATYVDATPDPDDIPGSVVNAFSFLAGEVAVHAAEGVEAAPPEARPGRVVLRLDLPAERLGARRVRVAYQGNEGSAEAPAWRDLASADATVELAAEGPVFLQLRQDPGRMEFSGFPRRKMKNVDTFRIDPVVE